MGAHDIPYVDANAQACMGLCDISPLHQLYIVVVPPYICIDS